MLTKAKAEAEHLAAGSFASPEREGPDPLGAFQGDADAAPHASMPVSSPSSPRLEEAIELAASKQRCRMLEGELAEVVAQAETLRRGLASSEEAIEAMQGQLALWERNRGEDGAEGAAIAQERLIQEERLMQEERLIQEELAQAKSDLAALRGSVSSLEAENALLREEGGALGLVQARVRELVELRDLEARAKKEEIQAAEDRAAASEAECHRLKQRLAEMSPVKAAALGSVSPVSPRSNRGKTGIPLPGGQAAIASPEERFLLEQEVVSLRGELERVRAKEAVGEKERERLQREAPVRVRVRVRSESPLLALLSPPTQPPSLKALMPSPSLATLGKQAPGHRRRYSLGEGESPRGARGG